LAAKIPASITDYKSYLDFNNSVLPEFELTDREFEIAYFSLKKKTRVQVMMKLVLMS